MNKNKNDGSAGPAVFLNFYVPEPPLFIVSTPWVHHAQIDYGHKGIIAIGVRNVKVTAIICDNSYNYQEILRISSKLPIVA